MTRKATIIEAGLAVLALLLVLDHFFGHETRDDAKLATLHTHTVVTQTIAAEAEKVLVTDTVPIQAARDSLRTFRDSVLAHPAERIKEYVTRTERVVALDSTALAQAATVIHDLHDVVSAKDAELVEALKPVPVPRLRTTVAGLYNPISATISAEGGVSLRVIGGLALTARVEQRAAIGERPEARVGLSYQF